jgi:hypothetical protein
LWVFWLAADEGMGRYLAGPGAKPVDRRFN